MIQQLIEAVIVGGCHELRARPAPWLVQPGWSRASALAVIEFYEERDRCARACAMVIGATLGGAMALYGIAASQLFMRRRAA